MELLTEVFVDAWRDNLLAVALAVRPNLRICIYLSVILLLILMGFRIRY